MARIHTWEISDEFWSRVEPLIPASPRIAGKTYRRKPGGGPQAEVLGPAVLCRDCVRAAHGDYLERVAAGEVRGPWLGGGSPEVSTMGEGRFFSRSLAAGRGRI